MFSRSGIRSAGETNTGYFGWLFQGEDMCNPGSKEERELWNQEEEDENKQTGKSKCTWQRKKRSLLLWLLHTFPDAPANSTASSLEPPERIKTSMLALPVFCICANCPNHSCQVWGGSVLEPSLGHVYDKYQIQEASPFYSQQGAESTWPPGVSAHAMWLGQADRVF